jgi:uncharacterized metal-binding protein YceD (DUF177 family)
MEGYRDGRGGNVVSLEFVNADFQFSVQLDLPCSRSLGRTIYALL